MLCGCFSLLLFITGEEITSFYLNTLKSTIHNIKDSLNFYSPLLIFIFYSEVNILIPLIQQYTKKITWLMILNSIIDYLKVFYYCFIYVLSVIPALGGIFIGLLLYMPLYLLFFSYDILKGTTTLYKFNSYLLQFTLVYELRSMINLFLSLKIGNKFVYLNLLFKVIQASFVLWSLIFFPSNPFSIEVLILWISKDTHFTNNLLFELDIFTNTTLNYKINNSYFEFNWNTLDSLFEPLKPYLGLFNLEIIQKEITEFISNNLNLDLGYSTVIDFIKGRFNDFYNGQNPYNRGDGDQPGNSPFFNENNTRAYYEDDDEDEGDNWKDRIFKLLTPSLRYDNLDIGLTGTIDGVETLTRRLTLGLPCNYNVPLTINTVLRDEIGQPGFVHFSIESCSSCNTAGEADQIECIANRFKNNPLDPRNSVGYFVHARRIARYSTFYSLLIKDMIDNCHPAILDQLDLFVETRGLILEVDQKNIELYFDNKTPSYLKNLCMLQMRQQTFSNRMEVFRFANTLASHQDQRVKWVALRIMSRCITLDR